MIYIITLALIALILTAWFIVLLVKSGWPDFPYKRVVTHKESKIIDMYGYVPKAVKK